MEWEKVTRLVDDLSGDEHAWVDFKVDYEIGGIHSKKAEFIRDVASLANTLTEKDTHYIIVGVDDDGEYVGITGGRENHRGEGPRHIFSFDESQIQQIIDSNLVPSPTITWHTFENDSKKFGVLEIEPLESPPCLTAKHIDENEKRHLHKGLIYVRKGSSKKIASREEIQEILEYRVRQQRERILNGVTKAIQIGPEWIDRISDALPEDEGIPLTAASDASEADFEITQRLTREPASTLDEQLNEDISQWKYRGDDFVEAKPLWQYYAGPNALTLDKTALMFLTQSAIKNEAFGGFWVAEADPEDRIDLLLETPKSHLRARRAGSVMLILDDSDGFDALLDTCGTNARYGYLKTCNRKLGNTIEDRVNFVLKGEQYSLNHNTWRREFNVKDFGVDQIRELLPTVAEHLVDLQEKVREHPSFGEEWTKFSNALWDLEVIYLGSVVGNYN